MESLAKLGAGENVNDKADECGQNFANRLLCDVDTEAMPVLGGGGNAPPPYVIQRLYAKLKRAQFFYNYKDDGTVTKSSGALSGNKVYAYRRWQRFEQILDLPAEERNQWLFVTLTRQYWKNEKGRQASWRGVHADLPKYLRKLYKAGMTDYCYVLEAHRDGGCHAHLVVRWNKGLKFRRMRDKLRLIDKSVFYAVDSNWNGHVDIQGVSDEGVKGYITKELGKYGHIEDALRRAKRDWQNEGDKERMDGDCKRLWTYYYSDKLKMRLYGICRRLGKAGGELQAADAADLINDMNNSTGARKAVTIAVIFVTRKIKQNPAFQPFNGLVEPTSGEFQLVRDLYRETKGQNWQEVINDYQTS